MHSIMSTNDIFKVLHEREGYNEQQAMLLAKDLSEINNGLFPLLKEWVNNGTMQDHSENGISIFNLVNINGMSYPAAISTMDWIMKEPEIALAIISRMTHE